MKRTVSVPTGTVVLCRKDQFSGQLITVQRFLSIKVDPGSWTIIYIIILRNIFMYSFHFLSTWKRCNCCIIKRPQRRESTSSVHVDSIAYRVTWEFFTPGKSLMEKLTRWRDSWQSSLDQR